MIVPAHADRVAAGYPAGFDAAAAPDRLAGPVAAFVILGLSLSLWAVLGAGVAWVAGWV